jgi:hypothetical protein
MQTIDRSRSCLLLSTGILSALFSLRRGLAFAPLRRSAP